MQRLRAEYEQPRLIAHVDRLAAWKRGEVFPPVRVNFSPVGRCNHRCVCCYTEYLGYPKLEMDRDTVLRVCIELAEYGVYQIMVEGIGENLLSPHLIDGLILSRQHGLPSWYLVTNGALMVPDNMRPLLAVMGTSDIIRVSQLEADAGRYAVTHGCSAREWGVVLDNLMALDHERTKGTLIVTVYPTERNAGTMRDAVLLAKSLGADIVSVSPPVLKAANVGQSYRQDLRRLHASELSNLPDLSDARCLVTVNNYWFDMIEGACSPPGCDGIDFHPVVGPDANVYPCFRYWLDRDFSYGDLTKQSFHEIWEGFHRQEVRRRVLDAGPDDGAKCKNCAHARMYRELHAIKHPSRFAGAI